MEIFISKDGETMGPLTDDQLQSMLAEGVVGPEDLAWEEGMDDWLPLHALRAFVPPPLPQSPAATPAEQPSTTAVHTAAVSEGPNQSSSNPKADTPLWKQNRVLLPVVGGVGCLLGGILLCLVLYIAGSIISSSNSNGVGSGGAGRLSGAEVASSIVGRWQVGNDPDSLLILDGKGGVYWPTSQFEGRYELSPDGTQLYFRAAGLVGAIIGIAAGATGNDAAFKFNVNLNGDVLTLMPLEASGEPAGFAVVYSRLD